MNKRNGFTLVELLISFTLLSLVLITALPLLGTQMRIYKAQKNLLGKRQIEQRVFALLAKDLRNCLALSVVSSAEINLQLKDQALNYALKNQKVRRKTKEETAYLTLEGEIETLGFKLAGPQLLELTVGQTRRRICLRNL
jgi:type II secretory pathway component PulJ